MTALILTAVSLIVIFALILGAFSFISQSDSGYDFSDPELDHIGNIGCCMLGLAFIIISIFVYTAFSQ